MRESDVDFSLDTRSDRSRDAARELDDFDAMVSFLPERAARICRMRIVDDMEFRAIGKEVGLAHSRVYHIYNESIGEIAHRYRP